MGTLARVERVSPEQVGCVVGGGDVPPKMVVALALPCVGLLVPPRRRPGKMRTGGPLAPSPSLLPRIAPSSVVSDRCCIPLVGVGLIVFGCLRLITVLTVVVAVVVTVVS